MSGFPINRTARPPASAAGGLAALYRSMAPRRRRHFFAMLLVMLLAAGAEMVAIGAVLPFVASLSGAAGGTHPGSAALHGLFGDRPLLASSLLLVAAAAAAALLRLLLLWLSQRFALSLGHDLAVAIFGRMLRQPYPVYLDRNSSALLSGLEKIQTVVATILQPLVQGFIALVIAAGIVAVLVLISPLATGVAASFVAASYVAISIATHGRLRRNSALLARLSRERIQAVQEALGGIRDILLDRSQAPFEQRFRTLDRRFRRAHAANLFMAGAPRYVIEAAGIAAIALIALMMSVRPGGIGAALPALAALALGAQRLLPLLQQAYFGWSQATGNLQALADVVALAEMPAAEEVSVQGGPIALPFARAIVFEDVSFSYDGGGPALRGVSVRIPRGARLGFAGRSGSGKSTFLDLLMGLLEPTEGEIRIDGRRLDDRTRRDWQARIAHVPQSVYLADDSIAANIAFGRPAARIDHGRVREAARRAQLDGFVASLPLGYETIVGERGIRLSGGERQRIGIARALYKQAELLILDEATSALDDETEAAVMKAVNALGDDVTIIVIAHRASTLDSCEAILWLEDGRIVDRGAAASAAADANFASNPS